MIAGVAASDASLNDRMFCQYDLVVLALMRDMNGMRDPMAAAGTSTSV